MNDRAQFPRASRFQFALALVCIALMFFATLAQALDSHELNLGPRNHQARATTLANSAPGFCLVCVAAHSPSVIAQVTRIHFVAKSYVVSTSIAANLHSLLTVFDLSVRPPPAV